MYLSCGLDNTGLLAPAGRCVHELVYTNEEKGLRFTILAFKAWGLGYYVFQLIYMSNAQEIL